MNVVILAAGVGKRMQSRLPKVLHPVAGRPMLARIVDTAFRLPCAHVVVVVGHQREDVQAAFTGSAIAWATQDEQLGTGHAVRQAVPFLDDSEQTLVLYGDVPLTRVETLRHLSQLAAEGSVDESPTPSTSGASAASAASATKPRLAVLTVTHDDPTGYGRIVRTDDGRSIAAIVEEKDATPEQRAITEVNTGILVAPTAALRDWLSRLSNDNAQREYYLTDIVALAHGDGVEVVAAHPAKRWETVGVNDQAQLAALERQYQRGLADDLMREGVRIVDPARLDIRGSLRCGSDVVVDVGCVFEGDVVLGDGVSVGPYAVVRHATIGAGTRVEAFCHVDGGSDGVDVGAGAVIGPYARLRPGARLADGVHIGNFVEVKNSVVGAGTKANHLSYLGDATIGAGVNVGAGTITCNYDGANKHRTTIGDDVQIGSDVQLVAPVTVGEGATVGAGTTVWKDVPPASLVVNEKTQVTRDDWRRPVKKA